MDASLAGHPFTIRDECLYDPAIIKPFRVVVACVEVMTKFCG